ncbi:hypothetical protein niasHS_008470 [Heterodera schachtii]|uniref:Uncharacterized protein n=1 Tax=Heterodera schachtii TaxID=97005 RepID=A0ABD2J144_HETSC
MKLRSEFFAESKLGPFLEEFAGLWLLAADIWPKFGQMPTKFVFMMANGCQLIRVDGPSQKCATFDHLAFEKRRAIRQQIIRPLISGGAQIDIKQMPWTVYFMANACARIRQKSPLNLMGRSAKLSECAYLPNDGHQRICVEKNTIQTVNQQ